MPSLTETPIPQMPTTTCNSRPGTLRTSAGPVQPPRRNPAASGPTAAQSTWPSTANATAATAFASPDTTFCTAFARGIGSASMGVSTASRRMPPAAPKYPTYIATQNRATKSTRPCSRPRPSASPRPGSGPRPGASPRPGMRPRPGSQGASSISEAAPISTGATRSNASGGVASSNAAPAPPPTAATGPRRRILAAWPASSGREPMVAPAPVNSSATVFVMFALNGGRPNASSAGYDTTEARLTTVLTIPATAPTATSPTAQATVTAPVPANSSCLQAPANSASSQAPVNPPCSQAPAGFRSPALPGRSRSFPVSSPGSFQQPQQPPRPGHLGTARQTSPPQFPVSRDHNAAAGEIMRQRGDLVIPAARGRDDPHPPILHHSLCRQPCLALDNEDEVREPRLTNHCVPARRGVVPRKARHATRHQPHQFLVEPHHGPGPVTPPAVGARSHDIGPVHDYRNLLPGTSGALLLRVRHPR